MATAGSTMASSINDHSRLRGKALPFFLITLSTKETGKKAKCMAKGNSSGATALPTKVNTNTAANMAKELSFSFRKNTTKANGSTASKTAKAVSTINLAKFCTKGSGKKES